MKAHLFPQLRFANPFVVRMSVGTLVWVMAGLGLSFKGMAQHQHEAPAKNTTTKAPIQSSKIMHQVLSDPELKDFEMKSALLEVAPGAVDTVDHRHDAELFGYILEGSIESQLETNAPMTFTTGQMFYEKRNILHSMFRNTSKTQPAKILLFFIIKQGRQTYTPEHAVKTGR